MSVPIRTAAVETPRGGDGVLLRVVPNARKTEVAGMHGAALKLKVASPALEGRANAEVLSFVAQTAGAPLRSVILVSGQKSRDKVVRVEGMSGVELQGALLGAGVAGGRAVS